MQALNKVSAATSLLRLNLMQVAALRTGTVCHWHTRASVSPAAALAYSYHNISSWQMPQSLSALIICTRQSNSVVIGCSHGAHAMATHA